MKTKAYLYYDILSPFTYFFIKLRKPLETQLELIPVPVFLAGLLRLQNNRGPAEIASKREYTYRWCVWFAQHHQIPFQFPPRHPFSSVAAQRLLLNLNADFHLIEKAFDFVWAHGNDPESQWGDFCEVLGLPPDTPKSQEESVKLELTTHTNEAASFGIFGLPTVRIEKEIFWGCESIPMILDFANDPNLFHSNAYQEISLIDNPLSQKTGG
jgi:2-hydroxychromene-2-carboxylate isomerase